jgi:putative hydrolase of the HAD superfamily
VPEDGGVLTDLRGLDPGATELNEKSLGQRLQQARRAAGLTQQQLCQKANLSYSTLAKIERGAIKAPSIFTIQSIAGAVGTGLDDLIGVKSPALPPKPKHKTKSGVSFIYFDVNGSLVHFYQRAFTEIARDTGVAADFVEMAFWHYNDEACRGALSMDDFNTALAKRLGLGYFDWRKYYLDAVEPIKPMQKLLFWAAERYQIGLISNIMPGFIAAMHRRGLLPDAAYDAVVDSSEVHAIKPEAKIYEIAAKRAGCAPEEILLIDDSRANLMAAEKLGWHVLWFDDSRAPESTASVRKAIQPAEQSL